MANEIAVGDRMQLRFSHGTNPETGNPIYRSRSYSNVKPGVDPGELLTVGEMIGDLTEASLSDVFRIKTYQLME